MHTHINVCTYMYRTYVQMEIFMYVYTFVCMYVCLCFYETPTLIASKVLYCYFPFNIPIRLHLPAAKACSIRHVLYLAFISSIERYVSFNYCSVLERILNFTLQAIIDSFTECLLLRYRCKRFREIPVEISLYMPS